MTSRNNSKDNSHDPRHPGRDPQVSIFAESDTELLLPGRKLVVVGYTHRTAPLAVRSRFAVTKEDLPPLARRFKALPGIDACILLTTCNRLEAYLEIRSEAEAEAAFVELVGGRDLEGRDILARSLMVRSEDQAVRHIFRVASGLDAMVLGDAQILGQVKQSYRTSCQHGTAGPRLHKAFHMAFRCAKAVRSRTDLGSGAQSVAGAAMSLLAREMGGLRGKDYLLVGVNQMTEAAGKRLLKAGAARLLLCNRTAEHARELAALLDTEQLPWSDLAAATSSVDAVVTCTGAAEPIFTRTGLAAIAASRPERPLTVVDMAVPPDVEKASAVPEQPAAPAAVDADSAQGEAEAPLKIIDLEDVGGYQKETEERRCEAAAAGEAIVREKVAAFSEWLRNQTLGPKMERMRDEAERSLARELAKLPGELGSEEKDKLAAFGKTLIKRFLGAYRRVEEE